MRGRAWNPWASFRGPEYRQLRARLIVRNKVIREEKVCDPINNDDSRNKISLVSYSLCHSASTLVPKGWGWPGSCKLRCSGQKCHCGHWPPLKNVTSAVHPVNKGPSHLPPACMFAYLEVYIALHPRNPSFFSPLRTSSSCIDLSLFFPLQHQQRFCKVDSQGKSAGGPASKFLLLKPSPTPLAKIWIPMTSEGTTLALPRP